MYDEIYKNPN